MQILWKSYEEYYGYVAPRVVMENNFQSHNIFSSFEHIKRLQEAKLELNSLVNELTKMGFADQWSSNEKWKKLPEARLHVLDLASAGEIFLFYNRRLAKSNASYIFLHQKDIDEHWERYSTSDRIFREVSELVLATKSMLEAYEDIVNEDSKFLLTDIDLPNELKADFVLARDLFSVGFDEVGLLITGRGLEGVLKAIAKKKRIKILVRGKQFFAHDARFYDLIEVLARVKWQKDKSRLISSDVKSLLHFLRSVRNSGAHPTADKNNSLVSYREMAMVSAQIANTLWEKVTIERARILRSTINKDW